MYYRPRFSYINAEDPEEYATPDIQPTHIWNISRTDIKVLRKNLILQWFFGSVELWILVFIATTLYFGQGNNPNRYTRNLDVDVIDFDGASAGFFFFNAFRQSPPGNSTLNWRFKGLGDFNNNIDEARQDVENGFVWATVILRSNTTRQVHKTLSAFLNTSTVLTSPFASLPPILVSYESGRNSFTIGSYVLPPIRSAIAVASARYSEMLRRELIRNLSSSSNSSTNRTLQLFNTFQLGSLLADPLAARFQDIHPAFPFVGQLATTLGYIYLYIISGLIIGGTIRFLSIYVGKIDVLDLILFRVINGIFQAFIISLIYSLIVLWFFDIDSGSLFIRYWMFTWLATLILALVIALFTVNLGPLGNSLLTAFVFLMLAGATIQTSLELAPRFYRYGYGLPLYHIINGARHLLFGSHERFGLTVGVLVLYFGVFWTMAIVTAILWLKRQERKIIREKQKVKEDKRKHFNTTTARYR